MSEFNVDDTAAGSRYDLFGRARKRGMRQTFPDRHDAAAGWILVSSTRMTV
jgi:hypothetical protein